MRGDNRQLLAKAVGSLLHFYFFLQKTSTHATIDHCPARIICVCALSLCLLGLPVLVDV